MGTEITNTRFSEADFAAFEASLAKETAQLKKHFDAHDFQYRGPVGGFELEAWLVDADARPLPRNEEFLGRLNNDEIVPELSAFNFEINVQPQNLRGKALSILETRLLKNWQQCVDTARDMQAMAVMIGIHPTIMDSQLNTENMSKSKRYKALNEQILKLRSQQPLIIDIEGREHLYIQHSDVMLEAATTSFQIHLKVRQDQAARAHTISQMISAPLLAVSANSPYAFGIDLWDESRIPIFEQAVDPGDDSNKRVTFDHFYARDSLFELFASNLKDYPVLIPETHFDDDLGFEHLRLHNGTVWRWNRPLLGFDRDGSLHLRIENRVVPAGPTVKDMIANAAFYWGLVEAWIADKHLRQQELPFAIARENFYTAAQHSLDCHLHWLDGARYSCVDLILEQLLPQAAQGLASLGIAKTEAQHYLDVIKQRVLRKQNGALWQRRWVEKHGRNMLALTQAYIQHQLTQQPVHLWDI